MAKSSSSRGKSRVTTEVGIAPRKGIDPSFDLDVAGPADLKGERCVGVPAMVPNKVRVVTDLHKIIPSLSATFFFGGAFRMVKIARIAIEFGKNFLTALSICVVISSQKRNLGIDVRDRAKAYAGLESDSAYLV